MSERVSYTVPGPKFSWGDDGSIQFSFINDPRSVIGPRPATASDRENHPDAWATFVREREAQDVAEPEAEADAAPAEPDLDKRSDEALRALIAEKTGTAPHHRTGRPKLLEQARALA